LPEPALVALWVGRLDPVKGLKELIEALGEINQTHALHLAIAGTGEYEPELRRQIEQRGLFDRVHLLGRRDDVASLLKAADLFVFPSYTEGLPNAVLEAMAAGLPVVTTDVPGCRDLIVHERNGLLVPARDSDALAQSMMRLMVDRPLAKRLASQARADLESHWSVETTYATYLSLYESVSRS
jgi:glycosyltransferase involved in cell wall biosynthesis